MALSLYRPSTAVADDISECRSFQYFQTRTAQVMSGYFEVDFWNHLVLQVCHVEPAVHHALVALSSLYEAYELNGAELKEISTSEVEPHTRFGFQQYTIAVGLLTTENSTNQPSLQGVLISCILFVWIEFLQGNINIALKHLQGGLHILAGLQQRSNTLKVDAALPRLLRRLHTQARFHGSPNSDFNTNMSEEYVNLGHPVLTTFSAISEAREAMDAMLDSIHRFLRRMYNFDFVVSTIKHHPYPDPLSLESTVQNHLENLEKWQAALESNSFLLRNPPDSILIASITILELQITSVDIMLKTLLARSEMIYDQYMPSFLHIISLASRLVPITPCGRLPTLSFDIGVITPLFLVALKCRHLSIRQRALELLKQAPSREGIWHRDSCVEFVEWKILMEEQRRGPVPLPLPLPESARIHSERSRQVLVDGKRMTVVRFKRGCAMDRMGEIEFEEEVTTLSDRMGEVL